MKQDKINIIIPIRDREQDLQILLGKLQEYIDIHYQIIIIEQCRGKEFNKGVLNNIGFIEADKINFSTYYIFTDVDIIPNKKGIIPYQCMQGMNHLYGEPFCLGCIFSIDKNTYEKLNGFSNQYWGWGYEDSDLQIRCEILDTPINRSNFIKRQKLTVRHTAYLNNEKDAVLIDYAPFSVDEIRVRLKKNLHLFEECCKKYKKDANTIQADGIRNCRYEILNRQSVNEKITRILVNV